MSKARGMLRWHVNGRLGIAIQRAGARHILARLVDVDPARSAYDAARRQDTMASAVVDAYRRTSFADQETLCSEPVRFVGDS